MKRVLLIYFCLITLISVAQEKKIEELWSGIATKMKMSKKVRLDLEHQVRFNNDFQEYNYNFTELGLNYKPTKEIRIAGNYRFMFYERGLRHRYVLEGHYNFSPKNTKFYFHIRERFQTFVWNDDNSSISNVRNLFTIGYKANKLAKIYTTQEWFYRLDSYNKFKTYRGTLGVNWNLTKKVMLMTYYSYQTSINSDLKLVAHIIGLRAFYKIDFTKGE
jgi:hypothetical protein